MKYSEHHYFKIVLTVLSAICLLYNAASAQSQLGSQYFSSYQQSNLTIEKGMELKQVLELVKKRFDLVFLYRTKLVKNKQVDQNRSLNEINFKSALEKLLSDQGLKLKYINPKTYGIYAKSVKKETKKEVLPQQVVSGKITDAKSGETLPGVNIMVKGTTIGTSSDSLGRYSLSVPSLQDTLVFSFIGYKKQVVPIDGRQTINVALRLQTISGQEMVVVGYGTQTKSSVVAGVTQVSGNDLEKTGDVPSLGMALTGKVPGVITEASTGLPGEEEPRIYVRGRSTWHDSSPLILVDGVQRPLNTVDRSEVKSVTVLKDASATAVYGVRGANGVILITTKNGTQGKAQITGSVNTTVKAPSKLPDVKDSYGTLQLRNEAIVHELALDPSSWSDYLAPELLNKYRKPQTQAEKMRYPNVNWDNVLFKDYSQSYHANLNVKGGSEYVQYYANASFLDEGDLFKQFNNDRGYQPGFGYKRLNVRSNLDFEITPSTTLKAKVSGSYGVKKRPWGFSGGDYHYWISAYSAPPDGFLPKYPDGSYGYNPNNTTDPNNSVRILSLSGVENVTNTQLTTNLELDQDLDMITEGLNFEGKIAVDNTFIEGNRGINDLYNAAQQKYINPWTGDVTYANTYDSNTRFDFQPSTIWSTDGGSIQNYSTYRKLYYELQLNYEFTLGKKNNFSEMALFNRTQNATGNIVPHRRENWVFRSTYNYNHKYMIEYNGSYNGSEKFNKDHRFAFFSSGGVAWNISNEEFMQSLTFLNNLKVRASYGKIGDDNTNGRWLYKTQWGYGGKANNNDGQTPIGTTGETATPSPYTWYYVSSVGNPNVHWATVTKTNLGLDFGFFDDQIKGSVDLFKDKRKDILIESANRAIPSYYGQTAPPANLGKVQNKGYEVTLNLNHTFAGGFNLWSEIDVTHSKNKVLFADDPALLPEYQKSEGHQVGQAYSHVSHGYYTSWDQLYASTKSNANDSNKLPGGKYIVDYNADGVIDSKDNIPYGFPGTPQNTYNASIGFNWKGFSGYVQFYGVNNVTRQVVLSSLGGHDLAYTVDGGYWSMGNPNASTQMPRWRTDANSYSEGSRYMYDGSYLRLKNAQIGYTFGPSSGLARNLGIESVKIYLNGDNLLLWTKMPDDREANYAGTGWASQGAYPTVRRYNFGININF